MEDYDKTMACIYLKNGVRLNVSITGDPTECEWWERFKENIVEPLPCKPSPATPEKYELYKRLIKDLEPKVSPSQRKVLDSMLEKLLSQLPATQSQKTPNL